MKNDLKVLTSYSFIVGLSLLLLNDFLFKEMYGNWWTGKLSDFAGLFIFPLFWTALFPKKKATLFWLTALLFIFWKSPFSQVFIDGWNGLGLFSISRVIDYTDLLALGILPIAYVVDRKISLQARLPIQPIFPLLISLFAFVATSKVPHNCIWEEDPVYQVKHYSRDSLLLDLEKSDLAVNLPAFNDTLQALFDYEEVKIYNLNDSIVELMILIGPFNEKDNTVEMQLVCWDWNFGEQSRYESDKATLERRRAYVKESFEKEVIEQISK